MNGPSLELQRVIDGRLKADTTVQSLLGSPPRIYQVVPPNPTFPYVTIGEDQALPDLAECIDGSEIFLTMHIFSRHGGGDYIEAKRIGAALEASLHDASLVLADNLRCLQIQRDGSRFFKDLEPTTVHGVVTFRALVEPV